MPFTFVTFEYQLLYLQKKKRIFLNIIDLAILIRYIRPITCILWHNHVYIVNYFNTFKHVNCHINLKNSICIHDFSNLKIIISCSLEFVGFRNSGCSVD
jgi:hypothetical protein